MASSSAIASAALIVGAHDARTDGAEPRVGARAHLSHFRLCSLRGPLARLEIRTTGCRPSSRAPAQAPRRRREAASPGRGRRCSDPLLKSFRSWRNLSPVTGRLARRPSASLQSQREALYSLERKYKVEPRQAAEAFFVAS